MRVELLGKWSFNSNDGSTLQFNPDGTSVSTQMLNGGDLSDPRTVAGHCTGKWTIVAGELTLTGITCDNTNLSTQSIQGRLETGVSCALIVATDRIVLHRDGSKCSSV